MFRADRALVSSRRSYFTEHRRGQPAAFVSHLEVLAWTVLSNEVAGAAYYYRLYTSINPTPLVLSFPRTIAVYAPGVRSAAIADSRSSLGSSPESSISAC